MTALPLTVTDRKPDSVTVHIGIKSATLYRSELVAGLRTVTDPGTCTQYALIRGLGFNRAELESLIREMGPRW